MCHAVNCKRCGKTTWAGCGQHVDQVMRGIPKSGRCSCEHPDRGGLVSMIRSIFGR